jgi:capsular exopolysaccharide synthesis family protein
MSEIFKWLRRAETQRPLQAEDGRHKAVALFPEEKKQSVADEEFQLEGAPVLSVTGRSDARLDLNLADARIRSVLNPLTLVGEQYRILRSKLSLMQRQRGIKTLLVASALPGEGKTFTACCLAGILAQEPGRRVLLIDADLRKPRTSRSLGLDSGAQLSGLSQVLRGEAAVDEVLVKSTTSDLFLLPAGPVPGDPAELLGSAHFEAVLRRMAEIFDWIVVDSAPVIALSDATHISPFCDAAILVVQAAKTPSRMIKEAIQRMGRDKICGVVMNRARPAKSSAYYYHYYHKGQGPTAG